VGSEIVGTLHVLNFITDALLQGRKPPAPPMQISLQTLQQAKRYVEYAATRKEIVMEIKINTYTSVCLRQFSTKTFVIVFNHMQQANNCYSLK